MTARAVLTTRRRRLLALVGIFDTLICGWLVWRIPGVYHQQVDVVFMSPQPQDSANTFQYSTQNLIKTAGIVATILNADRSGPKAATNTATLLGRGVHHGYSVRLPNSGGQWAYNFMDPMLNVEAVGTSAKEVQQTTNKVVSDINATLRELQAAEGTVPTAMIRTRLSPPSVTILYSVGSRIRALAATLLLGLGVTLAAVRGIDAWSSRLSGAFLKILAARRARQARWERAPV
jgi:hypothetical protein